MATSQTDAGEKREELSDIKRKLVWRMAFAGLLIVGLLGGLALFDQYTAPADPEPAAPQFTEPVPVPKKPTTQPLTPAEPSPSPSREAAEPEASAAPVDKAAPALEPPAQPQVAAQPALPRHGAAVGKAAPAPIVPKQHAEGKLAESRPLSAAPTRAEVPRPEAPRAEAPSAEAPPVVASPQPTPPRLFSGYALQAGVFADPRRAEELHAKLMLEGIPSSIEARVQVGPFKNKAEAEAARTRLKVLGIESVMLPPKGARR